MSSSVTKIRYKQEAFMVYALNYPLVYNEKRRDISTSFLNIKLKPVI